MIPVAMKPKQKRKERNAKYNQLNNYIYDKKSREHSTDLYLDKPWKKLLAYVVFFTIFGSMFLMVIRSQKDSPVEYVLDA